MVGFEFEFEFEFELNYLIILIMVKYNEKSKRNLPGVMKTRLANIL